MAEEPLEAKRREAVCRRVNYNTRDDGDDASWVAPSFPMTPSRSDWRLLLLALALETVAPLRPVCAFAVPAGNSCCPTPNTVSTKEK